MWPPGGFDWQLIVRARGAANLWTCRLLPAWISQTRPLLSTLKDKFNICHVCVRERLNLAMSSTVDSLLAKDKWALRIENTKTIYKRKHQQKKRKKEQKCGLSSSCGLLCMLWFNLQIFTLCKCKSIQIRYSCHKEQQTYRRRFRFLKGMKGVENKKHWLFSLSVC